MNSTRRFLFVVVVLSLLMSACTAAVPAAPGESASAPPVESVVIEQWFDVSSVGTETIDCIVESVVTPFNEMTEGVTVEAVYQANSWDATRVAVAGGGGPDVLTTPGPSFVFEMAQAGQALPLSDFAEQMGWDEIFAPWALSLGIVDGELYSVPNELETLVLYYNKTLFEEKGWEPPTTIAELMALSEAIAAEGIIPFSHANAEWRPSNEWFVGEFLNHVAGPDNVYLALTGQKSWADPEFVESIELLNTMQESGWFMGGLDRYYTATGDERLATWGAGDAAMNIEGSWRLDTVNNYFGDEAGNANEWDVVPMPSVSGDAIYDLGIGSTWSINAASEHPEAVAEYLTFYFSPDNQATLLTVCNMAPAPVALTEDILEGIDPRNASVFAGLTQSSQEGNYGYTTWTFWPPKSDIYIYEEIEKVWAGQMTTAEYLQGLDELFTEELEAGDIPPIPER